MTDGLPPEKLIVGGVLYRRVDGTSQAKCQECGAEFMVGNFTGRRKSAKYCSNKCRKRSHRRKHSMGQGGTTTKTTSAGTFAEQSKDRAMIQAGEADE